MVYIQYKFKVVHIQYHSNLFRYIGTYVHMCVCVCVCVCEWKSGRINAKMFIVISGWCNGEIIGYLNFFCILMCFYNLVQWIYYFKYLVKIFKRQIYNLNFLLELSFTFDLTQNLPLVGSVDKELYYSIRLY